jgi:hypothetical protein
VILLYIVKDKSNKIKVITDEKYKLLPDQNWMNFANAMSIYYKGVAFKYESDALKYQRERTFFIVKKNKIKEFSLKEYKLPNEKWKDFSKRIKKELKGEIYYNLEEAQRGKNAK